MIEDFLLLLEIKLNLFFRKMIRDFILNELVAETIYNIHVGKDGNQITGLPSHGGLVKTKNCRKFLENISLLLLPIP